MHSSRISLIKFMKRSGFNRGAEGVHTTKIIYSALLPPPNPHPPTLHPILRARNKTRRQSIPIPRQIDPRRPHQPREPSHGRAPGLQRDAFLRVEPPLPVQVEIGFLRVGLRVETQMPLGCHLCQNPPLVRSAQGHQLFHLLQTVQVAGPVR